MKKKHLSTLIILGLLSFSVLVFSLIYQNELPKLVEEINNGAIGVIFAAIVTVLLLNGQSKAEEEKEKNVKVFEKKSEKYEEFINKIWEVWEDRKIDLLELSELVKLLSKDIILYANEQTTKGIIDSLKIISDEVSRDNDIQKGINKNNEIQKQVYRIVQLLALDLKISEEVNENTLKELYNLEDKIFPAIEEKIKKEELIKIKNKFIDDIKIYLLQNCEDFDLSDILYNESYYGGCGLLMGRINNSSIYFQLRHLNKKIYDKHSVLLYVDKKVTNYAEKGYKISGKGGSLENQTTLKNSIKTLERKIAFDDYNFTNSQIENKGLEEIVKIIGDFIISSLIDYNCNNKTIIEIINECEPNLQENKK